MADNFITKIYIEKSRNIENFEILLSKNKKEHLILTGKNGSGKTSLLNELHQFLFQVQNGKIRDLYSQIDYRRQLESNLLNYALISEERLKIERQITASEFWLSDFGGTRISFSASEEIIYNKFQEGKFLIAFFSAKRHLKLDIPRGIYKVPFQQKYDSHENANVNFIQYIVNLKAERSFAKDDNEIETVKKIDLWFENFEDKLKSILGAEKLNLRFDRNTYNFDIIIDDGLPVNFNNLSDGYSAIISIVTELILRMDAQDVKSFDLDGVVIIDEIETHLHVDLQKQILPFLIDFFPNIQFIVTTHSPFVLSSIPNTTICDLETKIVTKDLTSYSYDALIESYFKSDKYSTEIKLKIIEFEKLLSIENMSIIEKERLRDLRNYFVHSPKYLSTELMVKLQELELKELTSQKR